MRLRQSFENQAKIQETRSIYEDLLSDVIEAISKIQREEKALKMIQRQGSKETPPKIKTIKVNGTVPASGLSPRILKSMSNSKAQQVKPAVV